MPLRKSTTTKLLTFLSLVQSEMVRLGFDSAVATSQELVEFCERLEFDEDLNQKPEAMPNPGPSGGKTGRSHALLKSFRGGQSKDLKQMISRMEVPTDKFLISYSEHTR